MPEADKSKHQPGSLSHTQLANSGRQEKAPIICTEILVYFSALGEDPNQAMFRFIPDCAQRSLLVMLEWSRVGQSYAMPEIKLCKESAITSIFLSVPQLLR